MRIQPQKETCVVDMDGNHILLGDEVSLFDMVGTVVFESGAYGIAFPDYIDWDLLDGKIYPVTGCNNSPYFCRNDNFISFWEILWNYNCEEDFCTVVKILKHEEE